MAPTVPSWEMCCYVCGNMVEHYSSVSTDLEHVLEQKDLGIIIDSKLTFESHIEANAWPHKEELHLLRGRDCYSIV